MKKSALFRHFEYTLQRKMEIAFSITKTRSLNLKMLVSFCFVTHVQNGGRYTPLFFMFFAKIWIFDYNDQTYLKYIYINWFYVRAVLQNCN